MSEPYRIPLDDLERSVRTPRTEHVVLVGDGAGPPPVTETGPAPADADGE